MKTKRVVTILVVFLTFIPVFCMSKTKETEYEGLNEKVVSGIKNLVELYVDREIDGNFNAVYKALFAKDAIFNPGGDTEAVPIYIVTNYKIREIRDRKNGDFLVLVLFESVAKIKGVQVTIEKNNVEQGVIVRNESNSWKIYESFDDTIMGKERALKYFRNNDVVYEKLKNRM